MPESVTVRRMEERDLAAVVTAHRLAFRGFFLDRMGSSFLRGYYKAVTSYEHSLVLVAESTGEFAGFAAGFSSPEGFYAHFRRLRWRLIPTIVWALLRRPWLIADVVRGSTRVARRAAPPHTSAFAELSSIATVRRGAGIGSALIKAFIEFMRSEGCSQIELTTDEHDNDQVRRFYERHGFRDVGREVRGSRSLVIYRRDLNQQAPPVTLETCDRR